MFFKAKASRSARNFSAEINPPEIIKFPLRAKTAENSKAVYACINVGGDCLSARNRETGRLYQR